MKTFSEAINVKNADIDTVTGQKLTHREIYTRAINILGGLDAVIPYIPFSLEEIKEALKTDEHLNNLSMQKWDLASGFRCHQANCDLVGGGVWHLYRKAGINSASNAQGVCLLKEAARQWAERD
jgi:hypothetical protein